MTVIRKHALSVLLVALACGPASAQAVILTPEEGVLVERYIVEEPALPPPVVLEDNMTLRPGSIVPAGVELRPFNGRADLSKYGYFVSVDRKVVVVDPATRAVVRIFNAKS